MTTFMSLELKKEEKKKEKEKKGRNLKIHFLHNTIQPDLHSAAIILLKSQTLL